MNWSRREKCARSGARISRQSSCAWPRSRRAGGGARFVSVQNNYSLLHREPEAEVLPECEHLGIAFLPYFPLANGLLTGKYRKGQPFPKSSRAEDGFGPKVFTDENLTLVEQLRSFAESRGHTLLELSMAWLASKSVIASVIAGAKTPEQVKANASAVAWRFTEADVTRWTES